MAERIQEEKEAVADMRSHLYGFLAMVFRREVDTELLQRLKDDRFLKVLSEMGVHWQGSLSERPEGELLEDLAVEYARLFLGPGRHISPHESVHHRRDDGQWGQLWGRSTVEVKKFIETTGFHYEPDFTGMPDHICVELEFMERLTRREAEAWGEGDKDAALQCLNIEKKFIQEHLAPWVPGFCDQVIAQAELPFYADVARLTKRFMELEMEEGDDRPTERAQGPHETP